MGSVLENWSDVDLELKRLIKLEDKTCKLQAEMKASKELIEGFCKKHKRELKKDGSKTLTFGAITYSAVDKILIRSISGCVTALNALGLSDCIKEAKEPNKEAMLRLDPVILEKVGASKKTEEKFKIETYKGV